MSSPLNFEGPLTKRVLMSLPTGMLLQSNVCRGGLNRPALEVVLEGPEWRQKVWVRVRSLRLSGTKFRGFSDAGSYRMHMAQREFILLPNAPTIH
jgi:hypothetical protein